MTNFNDRLRYLLKLRKWKQNRLAIKIGCTAANVSLWIKGKHTPDISVIREISSLLGCNPIWLEHGEGNPETEINNDSTVHEKSPSYNKGLSGNLYLYAAMAEQENTIGSRVTAALNIQNLNNKEAARKYNVSATTVASWKDGKIADLRIKSLAVDSGLTFDYIKYGTGDKYSQNPHDLENDTSKKNISWLDLLDLLVSIKDGIHEHDMQKIFEILSKSNNKK